MNILKQNSNNKFFNLIIHDMLVNTAYLLSCSCV
jgi:hypothetical protein